MFFNPLLVDGAGRTRRHPLRPKQVQHSRRSEIDQLVLRAARRFDAAAASAAVELVVDTMCCLYAQMRQVQQTLGTGLRQPVYVSSISTTDGLGRRSGSDTSPSASTSRPAQRAQLLEAIAMPSAVYLCESSTVIPAIRWALDELAQLRHRQPTRPDQVVFAFSYHYDLEQPIEGSHGAILAAVSAAVVMDDDNIATLHGCVRDKMRKDAFEMVRGVALHEERKSAKQLRRPRNLISGWRFDDDAQIRFDTGRVIPTRGAFYIVGDGVCANGEHCEQSTNGVLTNGKNTWDCKSCGGCKLVRYCSLSCQKTHWEAHRKLCLRLRDSIAAIVQRESPHPSPDEPHCLDKSAHEFPFAKRVLNETETHAQTTSESVQSNRLLMDPQTIRERVCHNPACALSSCSPRAHAVLKACGRCQRVFYCCRPCQQADWADHRRSCVAQLVE